MVDCFDVFLAYYMEKDDELVEVVDNLEQQDVSIWEFQDSTVRKYLRKLAKKLSRHFNLEQLKTLCFDLNVDYESLRVHSNSKFERAQALVQHQFRRERLIELFEICTEQRKNVRWNIPPLHDIQSQLRLTSPDDIAAITSCAVVLIGKQGMPWEIPEVNACLEKFFAHNLPIIPVLLPSSKQPDSLPAFITADRLVDLRNSDSSSDIDLLVWRIRGVETAIEASKVVLDTTLAVKGEIVWEEKDAFIDEWGIPAVKNQLHALAEVAASAAQSLASEASQTYPNDPLTMLVPLVVDLRWHRGYASGVSRMLNVPHSQRYLRDFECREAVPPSPTLKGLLSAQASEDGKVVIYLDGHPAVEVYDLDQTSTQDIVRSVNCYGRLGVPSVGGLSLVERIGEVPIHSTRLSDDTAEMLYRNREVLFPLIARWGMPGDEWLLVEDGDYHAVTHRLLEALSLEHRSQQSLSKLIVEVEESTLGETSSSEFKADSAFDPRKLHGPMVGRTRYIGRKLPSRRSRGSARK